MLVLINDGSLLLIFSGQTPSKLLLYLGSGPILCIFLGSRNPSVQPFLHGSQAWWTDAEKDTQERPFYSICRSRLHRCTQCRQCGLMMTRNPKIANSPLVALGQPTFSPQITPSHRPILKPNSCLIRGPIRPTIPNRIHIRSAILSQCTGQAQTQINRWLEVMFCEYRPLSL